MKSSRNPIRKRAFTLSIGRCRVAKCTAMAGFASVLAAAIVLMASFARADTGTIQDVQHVVILMQENRSFDHYFGTLQGVRGFNDPDILLFQKGSSDLFQPSGGTNFVLPFPVTSSAIDDVSHSEGSGLQAWNNGWWNRWIFDKGPRTMVYYTRTNLNFYYALAEAYTLCDANFCSFVGPTFPNRIYLFSGTVDPVGAGGGPVLDNSVPTNGYQWTTYPERLQAAGVSWKVYRPPGDWFGDALQWFAQYKNAPPGNPLYDRGIATVTNVVAAFSSDVTNDTLPQVSWIIPTYDSSEHPSFYPESGETFVRQLVNALAANPTVFNSTVFIITYDENGGFFDHVPPPVPPPGTTNEFEVVYGNPLGPGVRVPMVIISPWTRGGKVCSQVFDHTSIIRFMETWTGVTEPNISAWRRQVCGDLTSAFDFTNPDYSFPNLPGVNGTYPAVPRQQAVPVQEPGIKTACPLPYQPNAWCNTVCASNRFYVTMTNAGSASVHFAIYPNAYRTDGPWQYDAPPGGAVSDSFAIPSGGQYDFTCYGPNGFQRRFAGGFTNDCSQIEVASLVDTNAGGLTLSLQNPGFAPASFTVTDNYGLGGPWTFSLPPASATNSTFQVIAGNHGWYDYTVTASTDPKFVRRLAGHIETGLFSLTEVPAIVGNALIVPTDILTGWVKDSQNHPIVGVGVSATATINGTNRIVTADTDAYGNYALNLTNGSWSVAVSCCCSTDSLSNLGNYACPTNQTIIIAGNNATNNFTVQICSVLIVTPSPLPVGEVGVFYNQALQASSCSPGFTWTQTGGSLPSGLSLSTNGILSGIPAGSGDIFNFTAQVTDGNNATTNQSFSLGISNAVQVATTSLPDGAFYNMTLSATGGQSPYTWSLSPGSANLPSNLSLTPDGMLSGMAATNGTFNFSVRVTDNLTGVADQPLSLNLLLPLLISTAGGQITVLWPVSATNYVLQSTTNLFPPNWMTVSDAAPGTAFTVSNAAPAQFFRLR